MAFDEEAKAVQETAKASGKAIDAAREAGGFLAKFIEAPLSTAADILNDRLKYARWERQHRLMMRANQFLKDAGLDAPTRKIPLNVGVPLLEAASLEEDDDLQDTWASMLVNASDAAAQVEIRRMFVSILEDMSGIEVKCMSQIASWYDPTSVVTRPYVMTYMLPDRTGPMEHIDLALSPPDNIAIAIRNLMRLGCIEAAPAVNGPSIRAVRCTELGFAFVKACTLRRSA